MGFADDVLNEIQRCLDEEFNGNKAEFARELDVNVMQIHHYLTGQRIQYLKKIGHIVDGLGGKVVFPGEDYEGGKQELVNRLISKLFEIPEVYEQASDIIDNMVQARNIVIHYGDGMKKLHDKIQQLPDESYGLDDTEEETEQ